MNPFHEELTEEDIKHRKMWKKLTRKEKMNWIFSNMWTKGLAGSKQTTLPIVYDEDD